MDALGRSNLTLAQWAFWTAHRLYPDKPLYNAAHSFTVNDHLDPDLFQRALQALVDSHDALRTVFAESAGVPERRVLPKLPVTLDRIDLSDASDPDAALHDWACCRAGHAFAAEDPLFDTAHVRLGPNRTAWYFNQHHLICDAWSSGLLVPRLAGFYADAAAGRLNGVAPFPHYDAFVEHEHALRQSDQGERASDYWRETLAHPPEPPAFYGRSNRSLPARVARCTCDLGVDRTRAIRDLAGRDGVFHKNANVTLSNIFFAVLAAFVSRVSGQGRLCIGQPHHNRDTDAFRDTAGLFLAMLPVCVDVTPEDTFLSLMDRVRTTIADGLRHRPCFAQNRTDARLFDVVLNFYNASFPDFNGVPIEQELYHPGWSLERLAVHVHDFTRTGRLHVYFDFDEAVFCEELRARAVTQFTNLLDAVIEDPARPLAACDFLTDDERQRVMGEWGGATAPGPDHPTITAWIESRAAERPDATAVDCEGRTLSYAQLNSRANQLARVLVRKGVGHESIVAICLGPTPEAVVAILAVLKAGGAYLPLDPAYPDERLSFMVTDSAASMVLTDSRHAERFASADRVDITTLASEIDAEDVDDLEPVAGADSLAYVIYTSGSTGEPKGTLLEHRGLCNTVHALIDGFRIDEESRLLQFASASFDASVADIFCALVSGATLCLAPRDKMLSPDDLVSLVRDMNATFVTLPPTMLRLLEPGDMPSLRTVVSAGERCPADLAQTWVARDGLRFVNGYGPTENTVCTTMWVCSDHDDPVPIGRPIPNVRVYVLDETGHPVPQGAPGELCIGGAGLARGYLNRPDLTAERFIQNPLDDSSTSRLYRTGDWVRFRDDGALEYLGRTDGQIKVRGFRVELGEIESALRDAPAVKDAVASVTEGARGDGRLMVYIVSDGTPDVDALRAHLRRSLPEYMMPSGFAVLDRIPMTPSGKVDRAALPVRGEGQLLGTHHGHEERTPIQETVAEIWGHVLETPPPGNHDNFFDLGGHSILSVHVIAQVKKRFGVDIPLPRFFAAPTVAGMAEIIQSTQEGEGTTDTDALPFTCVPIRPTGSRPPFFCVATAGGVLFPYFKLAPLMSPDQPLYGLQDPALDGEHPQIETVEELAAHYVEVMCMVEPRGPYMFGGYSFGGIVAFEMAQQLVRAGKEVALVVLMDNGVEPPEFRKPKGVVDAVRLFSKRFPFLVESLYNVKPHIVDGLYILGKRAQTRRDHAPGRHRASPLDYLRWLWTDLILSKAGVANVLSKDAVVAMRVPSFKPVMKLLNVNGQAGESYRPQVYPGKVTLFRASRRPPELQGDSTLGWDRIAEGGVDTRHISGDHMRMLGDSVAEVADNLDDCIRIALKKHDAAETSPAEDSV